MKRFSRNTDFWTIPTPNKVGPGSYNLTQSKKPRSSSVPFSKSEVKTSVSKVKPSSLPGPGSYIPQEDWHKSSSPSSSFISKLPRTGPIPVGIAGSVNSFDTPGPGAYNTASPNLSRPKRHFRQLSMIVEATVASIPYKPGENSVLGPTTYNPDSSSTKPKIPAINFSAGMSRKGAFEVKTNPVIGPGKYNIVPERQFEKPNWVFLSKVNKSTEKKVDQAPGPGSYNPKQYMKQPRVLVEGFGSTTEREICSNYDQSFSPKPTELLYDLSKAEIYRQKYLNPKTPIPKPAFGTSEKRESQWVNMSTIVGPGDYQILKTNPNHAKFVSRSPRFSHSKADFLPGPGSYDSSNPVTHTVAISKAIRFNEKKIEGPESYLGHEEWKLKQNRAKDAQYYEPNLRFESSSPRFLQSDIESPGPGHYKVYEKPKTKSVIKSTENRFAQHGSYIKSSNTEADIGPGSYYKEIGIGKKTYNISPEMGDEKPWI